MSDVPSAPEAFFTQYLPERLAQAALPRVSSAGSVVFSVPGSGTYSFRLLDGKLGQGNVVLCEEDGLNPGRVAESVEIDHGDRRFVVQRDRIGINPIANLVAIEHGAGNVVVVLQGVLRPPAAPGGPFVLEGAGFQVNIKTPRPAEPAGEPPQS